MKKSHSFLSILSSAFFVGVLISCFNQCSNPIDEEILPIDKSTLKVIGAVKGYQTKSAKRYFETGFSILTGHDFFESDKISVSLEKTPDKIIVNVSINLGDSINFPVVYNTHFKQEEDADRLQLNLTGYDPENRKLFTSSDVANLFQNEAGFTLQIMPQHFKSLKPGVHKLKLSLDFEYISFFGVPSGVKPIQTELIVPFKVHPIYQTTLYFKSLVLDEAETDNQLSGDMYGNDFKNGAPEIELKIFYDDYFVMEKFRANGYEINSSGQADFYRTKANKNFAIEIEDLDYFLNGRDYITDTLINITDMEGNTFRKFSFYCVEEIWMYCKTFGQVN